ncbi:MAG TPA: hypothetical protein VE287_11690, partial [Actinopolymorphaceae bacterium]|nr:hypothetical protein [Actinopolymorphaceae bacterium]
MLTRTSVERTSVDEAGGSGASAEAGASGTSADEGGGSGTSDEAGGSDTSDDGGGPATSGGADLSGLVDDDSARPQPSRLASLLDPPEPSRTWRRVRTPVLGWAGLGLVVLVGAGSGGVSGAAVMFGLYAAAVGAVAVARGRVGWAHLRTRTGGGATCGVAVMALVVGVSMAPATA